MINTQLFYAVILALVALAGAAVALSAVMQLAARSVPRPSQPPQGGSRRNLPPDPRPEPDGLRELVPDDIRELVPDDIRELVPDDTRELVLH
jgi:hypothetical protein